MVYREGLRVGYRHFAGRPVAFAFGHGLSYTSFEYRDLRLSAAAIGTAEPLHLSLTLANTGTVEAAEVVQLYVHPRARAVPNAQPRPEVELRAFAKVLHLPYISPISPLYLPSSSCAPSPWCAWCRALYLPHVSPISPLYLPYISPISPRCG